MTNIGGLGFHSRFRNNCVFILDALTDDDLQTGRRLEEHIASLRSPDESPYCERVRVESSQDLEDALSDIQGLAERRGVKPIVHIEAHGDATRGVQVGRSEFVSWAVLADACRKINISSGNNLGVVLAACFGFNAISATTIRRQSSAYFVMGPEVEVSAGKVQEVTAKFYQTLYERLDLDAAVATVSPWFRVFQADKFFVVAFAKYLRRACMGKGGRARAERLLTEVLMAGQSTGDLQKLRASAKSFVRDKEWQRNAYERGAAFFLHGQVPVPFEELDQFVQDSVRAARGGQRA